MEQEMGLSYLTKIGASGEGECESTVFARMTEVREVWLP